MGYISNLIRSKGTQRKDRTSFVANRVDRGSGRDLWSQVFGSTSKEDINPHKRDVTPGGSYTQSVTGTEAAIKRLMQAMRSNAPGGWTDDRYEQSKHFTGVNYIAIHRTGMLFSQSEFQVYRKDPTHPEGKVPVTQDDPPEGDRLCKPYDLVRLLERPNDDDSFGDLLYCWNQQMDLTGSALTWMVPNKLSTPMLLYPVATAVAIPQPVINPDFPDGYYRVQPLYPYGPFSSYPSPTTSVGAPLPNQWIMRMKYHHPLLRYEGYSPLTAMNLQSDSVTAIDRSRFYKMMRTFNPNVILQLEEAVGAQPLPEAEINRIRAELMNLFFGPENVGGLVVAPPGGKFEEYGNAPREMEYQAGWEQLMSFLLSGFGITKSVAGMLEDTSYASLYASLRQFHWLTLEPKANMVAAKITRHIAPFFGDDLIVEIRCRRIDDHDITFTKIDKGIAAKCITKNEVRQELGYAQTQEEWGEEIAGFEEPPQQPGMPGMPGGEEQPGQDNGELGPFADMVGDEDNPAEDNRPSPDKLSEGSLGPKMKKLHNRFRKAKKQPNVFAGSNGNGRH